MLISEYCSCCKHVPELKSIIDSNYKSTKSVQKQIMTQLFLLNNSNTKICNALKNMDHKLQIIMKSNGTLRSLALPIPVVPSSLVGMLPAKSIEEIDAVELLLSDDTVNGMKNLQEELVSK